MHFLALAFSWLVTLGEHRETNEQYASAFDAYLQAERELRVATDDRSIELRAVVRDRIQRLAPQLSSLKVIVAEETPDLEIVRDDEPISADEWNRDMIIDGGTYRITVRAPGRRTWSTTVHVNSTNDRQIVAIPRLIASR